MKYKYEHTHLVIGIALSKLILTGLKPADAICVFVLLLSIHASKVLEYLYPKRPDLFNDISVVKDQIQSLIIKNEELERDVTGLKFGLSKR